MALDIVSYRIRKTVKVWRTGYTWPLTVYSYPGNLYQVQSYRDAPTDGVFEPNVYKTTAMHVQRRVARLAPAQLWYDDYRPGKYPRWYEYRMDGPLSAPVYNGIPFNILKPEFNSELVLALQTAAANVGKADMELGVELGELRETIGFIMKPRILSLLNHLRRVRPSDLRRWTRKEGSRKWLRKKALDGYSDAHLEFRYALMPLVRSVMDAIELLEKGLSNLALERIYTGRGKASGKWTYTKSDFKWICNEQVDYKIKIDYEATARSQVHYRFNDLPTAYSLLGLGVEHIPEVMWELTTLSFIWDWFLNLGKIIGAHRWQPNITVLGNTVGLKTIGVGVIDYKLRNELWQGECPPGEFVHEEYQRFKNEPIPWTITFKPIDLSMAQIADLFLIARQILSKVR